MRGWHSMMAELLPLVFITSCLLFVAVSCNSIDVERQSINLDDDGGYTDLLVGIGEKVEENQAIVDNLKAYFTEASKVLNRATKGRLYFKHITIVVPTNWTEYPNSSQPTANETYRRSRVLVDEANGAWGDVPYTLQPEGCGEEGEYVHLTPEYLLKDPASDITHSPAKRLVREFAHLRWGLFDEDIPITDKTSSRFYVQDGDFIPIGCSGRFSGNNRNTITKGSFCLLDDQFMYPPTCVFQPNSSDSTGSLLNFEYLNTVVDFCGSSDQTPHNTVAPNRQNAKCHFRSAWDVMNNLTDFEVDYSIARNGTEPSNPVFRVVQIPPLPATEPTTTLSLSTTTEAAEIVIECEQDIVCLCLDVSGSMGTQNRIGIMSQSVQTYILSHLRNDTAVGIVSFESTPHLLADMTVITDSQVRVDLASRVPTVASGGTGIGGGLLNCQEILHKYAGDQVNKTRILLLSDGGENSEPRVAEVLLGLVADGIVIDTVLYGQGAVSYNIESQTGGSGIFVTDKTGSQGLDLFFQETASRGCEEIHQEAMVSNSEIVLEDGEQTYSGVQYLDVTIGVNTKLVFKYSDEIDVLVSTPENNSVIKTHYPDSRVVEVVVEGQVANKVDFTITKVADINTRVTVVTSVTSSPVPGAQPIVISNKINNDNIQFTNSTQLVGYVGAFQGLTPVHGLTIEVIVEQPNGTVSIIPYTDDGTGKDSIPGDGVYTGFLSAHQIHGNGFFSLRLEVSGEGFVPSSPFKISNRRKRCTDCAASLGNVTRTATGKVVKVRNWFPVPDLTPPEDIIDARILYAAADGDNVFTIGWTAPGDDLNIGQVASYEFAVGLNVSLSGLVPLPTEAILSNISTYLVPAGTELELQINASQINLTMFDVEDHTNISTYYFRLRSADTRGNIANWSNPVSASYINPDLYTTPEPTTTTMSTTTTAMPSTTTNAIESTTTNIKTTTGFLTKNNLKATTKASSQENTTTLTIYLCSSFAGLLLVVIVVVGVCRYRRRGKYALVATSDTMACKDPQVISLTPDQQITPL